MNPARPQLGGFLLLEDKHAALFTLHFAPALCACTLHSALLLMLPKQEVNEVTVIRVATVGQLNKIKQNKVNEVTVIRVATVGQLKSKQLK